MEIVSNLIINFQFSDIIDVEEIIRIVLLVHFCIVVSYYSYCPREL
jgi:hypothetical protein